MAHTARRALPARLAPFVGRHADLERLGMLLRDRSVRLLTIVGPGGIGKTALALELVAKVQGSFRDGVAFVRLANLATADEVLPAVAEALGVRLSPGTDLQQAVQDHLSGREMLLVLDNFEHLLDEALIVPDILSAAPGVRMLITSREKLNVEAENLYHLEGLQVPAVEGQPDAGECDAIRLFVQKARQVDHRFILDGLNAPAVIRICRYVAGNPLAILLAASWAEHYAPAEIETQICASLDFLSHNNRDAEQRHSGIRAVFESSFQRLDERERSILRALSVFRGGFAVQAARAVANADTGQLIALVEKSLLIHDLEAGRYALHDLLRQYAADELAKAGNGDVVSVLHAAYYTSFVCERAAQLVSLEQGSALDGIQAELDNIRTAWSWVVGRREYGAAADMLPGLYAFCDMRSRFYEGESMFREAVEGLRPRASEPPRSAWALALLSWFDMRKYIEPFESLEQLASEAERSLEQARLENDTMGIAASLVLLGAIAQDRGCYAAGISHYEEAMQCFSWIDDFYWVNMRIGLSYQAAGELSKAIDAFRLCLRRGEQTGERVKAGWALLNIGDTLSTQGKPSEAERHLRQAEAMFKEAGTTIGVLWSTYSLSRVARELLKPALALQLVRDAGQLARQVHSPSWIAKTDQLLAQLDPEAARPMTAPQYQQRQPLSEREMAVLQLLKTEMSGPEIAHQLVVSLNTVRYHTKHIYQKLGANTRLEAIARAKELGV